MPIKLNDSAKNLNQRFKRKDVKDMVQYHRNNAPFKKLHYSHFKLEEILNLFKDNGVIDFTTPLQSQLVTIKRHGVKLYPGVHFKLETCLGKPEYLKHSNIIICNTEIDSNNCYNDMLDDNKYHSITMAGENDGLDMGKICPPECDEPDIAL